MCLGAENTIGLFSTALTPSRLLYYSTLGASTGSLAHNVHFISEKPLYDFIWSSPAPSVHSPLVKLSELLKRFAHSWREVPTESRAQNPVRDMPPVLSCIWTDRVKETLTVASQHRQENHESILRHIENREPLAPNQCPWLTLLPAHVNSHSCDSIEWGVHSCLVWVTCSGFFIQSYFCCSYLSSPFILY